MNPAPTFLVLSLAKQVLLLSYVRNGLLCHNKHTYYLHVEINIPLRNLNLIKYRTPTV
jgi:hypothetical protein